MSIKNNLEKSFQGRCVLALYNILSILFIPIVFVFSIFGFNKLIKNIYELMSSTEIKENSLPTGRKEKIGEKDKEGFIQVEHKSAEVTSSGKVVIDNKVEKLPDGITHETVSKIEKIGISVEKINKNHIEEKPVSGRSLEDVLKAAKKLKVFVGMFLFLSLSAYSSETKEVPLDLYNDMLHYLTQYKEIKDSTPEIKFQPITVIQDVDGRVFIDSQGTMEIKISNLHYDVGFKPILKIHKVQKKEPFLKTSFGIINNINIEKEKLNWGLGVNYSIHRFINFHLGSTDSEILFGYGIMANKNMVICISKTHRNTTTLSLFFPFLLP